MGKTSRVRRWVGVVVICSLCLMVSTAEADDGFLEPFVEEIVARMIAFGVTEGVLIASDLLTSGVSAHYGMKGYKAPTFWLIMGYTSGGLNILMGSYLAAYPDADNQLIALGVLQIVLGAMDVGLTIWANTRPEKPKKKLSLSPIVIPDAQGNAAIGVGLRLVDW